jgi:hypothetical protein
VNRPSKSQRPPFRPDTLASMAQFAGYLQVGGDSPGVEALATVGPTAVGRTPCPVQLQ